MIRTRRHLVIFARAPRLGRGKRRLAADIGPVRAWRFYRAALLALIGRLSGGPWHLRIAVAEARDASHPVFAGLPVMIQPAGDLGMRMTGILRGLPPGPAVIVGSDIPTIRRVHIDRAFGALRHADIVFGPAPDGGYWLVGRSGRHPIPKGFMAEVRWSTRHALADTKATLPVTCRVAEIDSLADIDDGLAFRAYLDAGGTAR